MPFDKVRHLVVLMLENRSFDNMLGCAYDRNNHPKVTIPAGGPTFYGLDFAPDGTTPGGDYWNPSNTAYFAAPPTAPNKVPATEADPDDYKSPDPDPGEHFDRICAQIFGPGANRVKPANNQMLGFLLDYADSAGTTGAADIMRHYTPQHVPVITALAQNFAVCDRWFAASPTQTLPNRSFFHTGTSCGKVNNWPYDPFDFNVPTIFNLLDTLSATPWDPSKGPTWKIYKDSLLHILDRFPATSIQFPHLWLPPAQAAIQFRHLDDFHADAAAGNLPTYTFLEPRLLLDGNDQHPPRDIRPGEQLMYDVYETVRKSPHPEDILLTITYDEHGGCYDHVPPPFGATAPDAMRKDPPFDFDRWGVRVPAVFVSPYIAQGTVFRSDKIAPDGSIIPYDHTSILATIRKWLDIQTMLPSARIANAPVVDDRVLGLATPRAMPTIPPPHPVPLLERVDLHLTQPSNDLEICFAIGLTRSGQRRYGGA
jgi:phospholipase C